MRKLLIISAGVFATSLFFITSCTNTDTEMKAPLQNTTDTVNTPSTNEKGAQEGNEKDEKEMDEKENEKTDRSGNAKPESNGSSKDMQKETIENLQEAFKGETTASAKYAAYSKKAEQEGYHQIALLFKAASTAEKIHANNHKAVLQESGVNTPVIKPAFSVKTTKENLQDAITGESYEATTMYPQFLNTANKADNQLAMITFNYAYKTEKKHKALYESALTALQNNAVNSLATVFYICPTCGNTYETKAPSRCGISMTSGEKFIKINTI